MVPVNPPISNPIPTLGPDVERSLLSFLPMPDVLRFGQMNKTSARKMLGDRVVRKVTPAAPKLNPKPNSSPCAPPPHKLTKTGEQGLPILPEALDIFKKQLEERSQYAKITFSDLDHWEKLVKQLLPPNVSKPRLYIKKLSLQEESLDNQQFARLMSEYPSITELSLADTPMLTDQALALLPPGIIKLNLLGCDFTDAGIANLSKYVRLSDLNLSKCRMITDVAVRSLPESIISLDLSNCKQLTDEAIENLLKNKDGKSISRDIQILDLSYCRITDVAIGFLPRQLRELKLAKCRRLTNAALKFLPQHLVSLDLTSWQRQLARPPQPRQQQPLTAEALSFLPRTLKNLNFEFCTFTDDALHYLPPGILALDFSRCPQLKSNQLLHLPPGLIDLNLTNCKDLTNEVVKQLPQSIKFLRIYGCPQLSVEVLEMLSPGLEALSLKSSRIFNNDVVQKFRQKRPNLRIFL